MPSGALIPVKSLNFLGFDQDQGITQPLPYPRRQFTFEGIMKLRMGLFALATSLLVSVGIHDAAAQPTRGIAIENGWARKSPSDKSAANIYLDITNQSAVADELTSVWTPSAEAAVIMKPHWRGITMTMERVEGLTLEPGKSISMHPGGYQISVKGLIRPFHPGESIPVELHFRNAGRVEMSVLISNKLLVSKPKKKTSH